MNGFRHLDGAGAKLVAAACPCRGAPCAYTWGVFPQVPHPVTQWLSTLLHSEISPGALKITDTWAPLPATGLGRDLSISIFTSSQGTLMCNQDCEQS